MSLSHNDLTGTLPDLHELKNLEYMDLGTNRLTGSLPDWIGAWSQLKVMGFENNRLAGELPRVMASLTDLVTLDLKQNLFKGEIDVVNSMQNLEYLYLSQNGFAAYVDPELFLANLDSVRDLDVANNLLYGDEFPYRLLEKPNLKLLDISANALRGSIPEINKTNSVLEVLEINANGFTGMIPSSIEQLVNLKHLDMQMVSQVSEEASTFIVEKALDLCFQHCSCFIRTTL